MTERATWTKLLKRSFSVFESECASCGRLAAEPPDDRAAGLPDRALAQFTLTATAAQTQVPPVIDGVVADGEWNGASLVAAFVQFEPRRGEEATTVF